MSQSAYHDANTAARLQDATTAYRSAYDTLLAALRAGAASAAPPWVALCWDGESEYADDGTTGYSISRMWMETRDGKHHWIGGYWGDWNEVLLGQADDLDDAAASAALHAEVEGLQIGAAFSFQAKALGVGEDFLFAFAEAAMDAAEDARTDEGRIDLKPALAAAA